MVKKISIYLVVFTIASFIASNGIAASLRLPQLISDGMVLQRDMNLNIWGWAISGTKVQIDFYHKKYKTQTRPDGQWHLQIDAMKAGGPFEMRITADTTIILHNILIGDVWFCSGQSNMVVNMERVKEVYGSDIATANYPEIRNFFVPTLADIDKEHSDLPNSKWIPANPASVLNFGAVSYFFARHLYQKFHVPIGIINSSVGGTPVQAWMSKDAIQNFANYDGRLLKLKDTVNQSYLKLLAIIEKENQNKINQTPDQGLNGPKAWFDTTYIPKAWKHFWLPGYWADQGISGLNGIVWFRKDINISSEMASKITHLMMGRIVDADYVYVNGTLRGNTTYQYPPRRYVLPAGSLKPGKNLIVIRVINTNGKGGFVPDKGYFLASGKDTIDLRGDWQYKVGGVFDPAEQKPIVENLSTQNEPTSLYNTMVAPAIKYGVKGFVWYQGEANTGKPYEYKDLLTGLIKNWRSKWVEGDLPFLYAQLPGFMEVKYLPAESKWAELREAQLEALSTPKTGMAVTIDAGEWNDIHPLHKKDVGERLALVADKIAYGDSAIVASGPLFSSASIENDKIVISFINIGSGLIAKNDTLLSQFAIAGADKKYHWANAKIVGDKVIVWSTAVEKPMFVRYAWADNPDGANLYNKEGLPASPFTTDNK